MNDRPAVVLRIVREDAWEEAFRIQDFGGGRKKVKDHFSPGFCRT